MTDADTPTREAAPASVTTHPAGGPSPRAEVDELPRYSRAAGLAHVRWRASSNESTIAPSPAIVEAITQAGRHAHLYPSLTGDDLVDDISARLAVPPSQVVVGGGSLAVLQQALSAYTGHGTEVIHAWRSYEAYPILVGIAGAKAVPVALDAVHTHDVDALLAAISSKTKAMIVCNPNNPTGTELTRAELDRLIAGVPKHILILLDEAYQEFASTPVDGLDLMRAHSNVAIFRTFSKAYGLAGLRAGYMVAPEPIAATVRAASPPFGLSSIAEAAARAAWADTYHTAHIIDVVTAGRQFLRDGLAERGIETPNSGANFVWIPVAEKARTLESACVANGVSVRAFPGEGVRVTVGERDAEQAVLASVDSLNGLLSHGESVDTASAR